MAKIMPASRGPRRPRKDKGIGRCAKRAMADVLTNHDKPNAALARNDVQLEQKEDLEVKEVCKSEAETDECLSMLLKNEARRMMVEQWESDKEQEASSGMEL